MKRALLAIALLVSVAGCKTKNPFDTASMRNDLEERDQRVIYLQQQMVYAGIERPPDENVGELAPNLDAWRAADVQKAEAATLLTMEQQATGRIALLETQIAELEKRPTRVVHAEWLTAHNDLVVERKKRTIIQAEIHARVGSR
jgi:hypothetical protein